MAHLIGSCGGITPDSDPSPVDIHLYCVPVIKSCGDESEKSQLLVLPDQAVAVLESCSRKGFLYKAINFVRMVTETSNLDHRCKKTWEIYQQAPLGSMSPPILEVFDGSI